MTGGQHSSLWELRTHEGEGLLTKFVEALGSLGDFPAATLQLPLQPLAQVQDPNDPAQQVTGHLRNTQKATVR